MTTYQITLLLPDDTVHSPRKIHERVRANNVVLMEDFIQFVDERDNVVGYYMRDHVLSVRDVDSIPTPHTASTLRGGLPEDTEIT